MINQPHCFEGLNIRMLIIIPTKGMGFINPWSGLMGTRRDYCRYIKAPLIPYLGASTVGGMELSYNCCNIL